MGVPLWDCNIRFHSKLHTHNPRGDINMQKLNRKNEKLETLKQWTKPEIVDVDASVDAIQSSVGPSSDFNFSSSS